MIQAQRLHTWLAAFAASITVLCSIELALGDGPGRPQYLPISAKAELGGATILLEVARTPEERALGLMFRPALPKDRGMLFPSDPARPARMWMKNVPVPLDLVFLHEGRVVGLGESIPPCAETPCPSYGPFGRPVDQVIELRAGRIGELGLRLDDPVHVTPLATDERPDLGTEPSSSTR